MRNGVSTSLLEVWTARSLAYAVMKTAQEMLDAYIAAERAVLLGQSYRFGERQLTRADLAEIRAGRKEWQARVDRAAYGGRRARWANADFGGTT